MKKVYHIIASGLCGVGMADGLYSIYHTNPPYKVPTLLDVVDAQAADAQALSNDCRRIMIAIGSAYAKEARRLNV